MAKLIYVRRKTGHKLQYYPQPADDSGTRHNRKDRKADVVKDGVKQAFKGIVNVYALIPKPKTGGRPIEGATRLEKPHEKEPEYVEPSVETIQWARWPKEHTVYVPTLFHNGIATSRRYTEPGEYDKILMQNPGLIKKPNNEGIIRSFKRIYTQAYTRDDMKYKKEVYKLGVPFKYYDNEYNMWLEDMKRHEKPLSLEGNIIEGKNVNPDEVFRRRHGNKLKAIRLRKQKKCICRKRIRRGRK